MKSLLKLNKKDLKESSMSNKEIADAIINAFGTTDFDGTFDTGYKSFILPNGRFLDLTMSGEYEAEGIVHDVVYDWTLKNKIITKNQKDFSFIVNDLGWIRVNGGFFFIDLPEKSITSQQEQSLRDFIDTIYDTSENLEVSAGNQFVSFSLEYNDTSKIILKIKRYYNTRELKEELEQTNIYYRVEIEKTDSFFRSLDSIWSVFVDEDGIVRDEYSGDLRELEKIEDALEDIRQASKVFEDSLEVPGPKYFGYTKSAFTEYGYNKFKTEIESIMKALKVLGYHSFMYELKVGPENIAYSDEYQILYTEEENYIDIDNLNESGVNASWSQVYKLIKDEFGVTGTPPKFSSYILPTGEFLDLEKWWKDYYGSEEEDYDDVIRQKLFKGISDKEVDWTNISPSSFPVHSYVQYLINSKLGVKNSNIKTTNRLQDEDDTLVANGCIKINSGDTMYDNLYANLPNKRPTNQALDSLDEYIFHQFFKNNKKNIRVYVEGNTWTATKYEREDYPDTSEIIKKITKYYTTNKLDESVKQEVDSEGNTLTSEQINFFKYSKVRDRQGKLLVVFHGSQNKNWDTFRYKRGTSSGRLNFGKAFYFTADKDKATLYSYSPYNSSESGDLKVCYLNLVNPFIVDAEGMGIKTTYDNATKQMKDYVDKHKDVLSIVSYPYEVYMHMAKSGGHDGIIVNNIIDNPSGEQRPIDVYIAFKANQIKAISNKEPSSKNNINESDKTDIKQQIKDAIKSEDFGQYLPEFLYHATFSGTLDSIKKHGLGNFKSGYKSLWKLQYKQGVFLDTDADSAESFVEVSDDERLDTEDITIFKIPTSKLDHSLIEIDRNNDWNTDMLDENQFNSIEEYFSKVTYFYNGIISFADFVMIKNLNEDSKQSTIKLITRQSKDVKDIINRGETYVANYNRVSDRLKLQYKKLSEFFGMANLPIFCLPYDRQDMEDISGAKGMSVNSSTIVLEVPISEIHVMEYYDWSDFIYFTTETDDKEFELTKEESIEKIGLYLKNVDMSITSYENPQVIIKHIKPEWVVKNINESKIKESKQDTERFYQWAGKDIADRFFKQKQRMVSPYNDITWIMKNYKDAKDFESDLEFMEKKPTRKDIEVKGRECAEEVYSDSNWTVYKITSYESSVKYGKGTQWCITGTNTENGQDLVAGRGQFDRYINDENYDVYFYISKSSGDYRNTEKFALIYRNDNDWKLYDSADFIQVTSDAEDDADKWNPYDSGGEHINFPKVKGLPDINKAYQDLANYIGYSKPLIVENSSTKLPTEKDVLDAVEKLSDRDGISYNSLDNLFNSDVLFITPNGSVLNATKWAEHESFLNEVFFDFIENQNWQNDYNSDKGPYEYCVEKLKFITLNTGKGYSDYRCKVIIYDKLTSHQISLLQEWIKRRLDVGDTQLVVFCKGNQKKYDLNQEDEKTMMKKIKSCVVRGFLENKDKNS